MLTFEFAKPHRADPLGDSPYALLEFRLGCIQITECVDGREIARSGGAFQAMPRGFPSRSLEEHHARLRFALMRTCKKNFGQRDQLTAP